MLITEEYRAMQEKLHENKGYGIVGRQFGKMVSAIVDNAGIDSVLDYGAGHNMSLRETLKPDRPITYTAYDPGVPELAELPEPAELVCIIDVLEHIEPDCLDAVLDHLEELTQAVLFGTVCTREAKKTLSDGRNAHLIVKPMKWWLNKLWERDFEFQTVQMTQPHHFFFITHKAGLDLVDHRRQRPVS